MGVTMDRRRLAGLLALVLAASATIATSPPQPTPPPSLDETVRGSAELSVEHPAIVRLVDVRISGMDPSVSGGPMASVTLTPTAGGIDLDLEGAGEVRTSIVGREAGGSTATVGPSGAFRSLLDSQKPPRPVELECAKGLCEGRFALVVDAVGLAGAETIRVDWQVAAHVDLWGGVLAGGKPTLDVTVDEPEADGGAAAVSSAEVAGAATRLDAKHRLVMWRVSLILGDEALVERPGWPLVVLGRLRPISTVIEEPVDSTRSPLMGMFIEGIGDQAGNGLDLSPRDEVEFEPFWSCVSAEPCGADYTIGLVLADARPDVAVDAGWELDVRAIGVDGQTLPVTIVAEPIPPMPMISATIRGTYITGSEGTTGASGYTVTEQPGGAGRDDQWDGLRTPTYVTFRATMTSTGSAPLPTDGFGVHFGPRDVSPRMELGQEVVYAFSPGGSDCGRVPDCDLSGRFTSGIGQRTGTLKPGWQVTIEWELELGRGTTAIGGDSELSIEAIPIAAPSP